MSSNDSKASEVSREPSPRLRVAWAIGAADRTAHGNQRRHHPEVSATLCSLILMTSSPSCVILCVTYAGLHPATYGQACEVLVACIPHKLARHASLYVVKSKPARFWRRQHIANDLATVLDIRMRRPARNRAYVRVFRVTRQLLRIVIFLWTQYQSLCLKHCFQSFLHLFTGEFSAIVNAVQIAGDVREHRGRPPV